MATVINNPSEGSGDSSGVGFIVGIIIAVLIVGLFIVYLLPGLRDNQAQNNKDTQINVQLPDSSAPQQ